MSESIDLEMRMQAFRLIRSDRYRTAAAIVEAMKEDFPEASEEQIKRVLASLAAKILEDRR